MGAAKHDRSEDEARVVGLARTAASNGRASINAVGVRNVLGIPYDRARRMLDRLAADGRLQIVNDAHGRKRWALP
jgi:hypothetical protein